MSLLRRLAKNRNGLVGLILVSTYVLVALLSPWITPHDPLTMHIKNRLEGPSQTFLLGTDDYGRDTLSRLLVGARNSLKLAMMAVVFSAIVGSILGIAAGYLGGWFDTVVMRMVDILFAFPGIVLALLFVAALGPSEENVMWAIVIRSIPTYARTSRGPTLSVKAEEYITAIRSVGAGSGRIIMRHILPNVMAPIIVQTSLALSTGVLTDATLSFLGLGIQPPAPSWGSMVSQARANIEFAPWTAIFPSAAIALVVLGFNLLGDGLRDTLDPRLRKG